LLDSLLAPKYTLQKSQCRKQPVSRPSLPTKSPAYWRHWRYRIATAQGLVECGATVFLSSPREAKINKCIQSILSDHPFAKGRVFGYPYDLSSQQVETNLEQLFEKVGTVNHIVFMAGERLQRVPLEEAKLEKMQKTFHNRTIAAMLTAKIGARYVTKDRSSFITLTTGSICEKPIAGGWMMLATIGAATPRPTQQLAFAHQGQLHRAGCCSDGFLVWDGQETDRGIFEGS